MIYDKMFVAVRSNECCLCRSTEDLTGEHKIKAAALSQIFGSATMMIGHFDVTSKPKFAQGPKSKTLHFKSRLCCVCNSAATQPGDIAFDRFHPLVLKRFAIDQRCDTLFPFNEYREGSEEYLNVFRYFAKLLTCQIVDAGGPALPFLSAFATGLHERNIVKMKIQADPSYQDFNSVSTNFAAFAGHGGLVVNHSTAGELTGFHSTLTLGPIQYIYWIAFDGSVASDLHSASPDFYKFIRQAFADAMERPLSRHERRRLGFDTDS